MIPIKLEFEAFGPFAKKQVIDFRNFENDRLFLVSGQTGSGKTTIFDAITFSLYGQASGYTRQSDSFKSDFADESTISYVNFEFIVKGKQYSVRREPIQYRKKRNNNIVKENSTATLTLENGDILSGPATVDKYIEELIGITADQFKKIVMLPQGEFRRFLSDDSSEKQKILRKIFGTKILDDFTEQLRANTNQIKATLDSTYTECATYINSISCLDNEALEYEVGKNEKDVITTLSLLKDFNKELNKNAVSLKEEIQELTKQKEKLNIPYYKEINAKFSQLEKTKSELNQLEQQSEQVTEKKSKLALLKSVKEIAPLYQAINATTEKLQELSKKLLLYQTQFEENKVLLQKCEFQYKTAKADQESLPSYMQKIEDLKKQLELLQEIDMLEKTSERILLEQESLVENEKALTDYKKYVTLQNRKEDIKAKIDALHQCKNALKLYETTANAYLSEKENYQTVFHNFINGQASQLAKNLVVGEACPVCGSTEHPHPAKTDDAIISQEILDEAKQSYENIAQTLERTQSTLLQLLRNNELEQAEINPSRILSLITEKEEAECKLLQEVQNELDHIHLREDLAKLSPLPKVEAVEKKLNEQQQAIAVQKEKLDNTKSQLNGVLKKITDQTQNKDTILHGINTLQVKVNEITTSVQVIETKRNELLQNNAKLEEAISQSKQTLTEYQLQLEKNKADFDKQLTKISVEENTFTDILTQVEFIAPLEDEIIEYNKNMSVKSELLSSLNAQLQGLSPVNPGALQVEAEQIETEITNKNDSYITVTSALHANCELYEKLKKKQLQYEKLSKQFSEVNKLFEVANGKYSDKLNFERYVLATYFNDVITNANLRLEQMTGSRYTLIRRAEKEKGNKTSGLSLDVFDTYTGKTRHVNTLSGGESFKIALSLALGMADIISQNSGGIELNTLFIDEGFGSLDSNSLDQAIECLNDLRSNGRYIGIISHVNELKEKIPAKISVVQQPTGSYIEK